MKEGHKPTYEGPTIHQGAPMGVECALLPYWALGHRLALNLSPKNHIYSIKYLHKFSSCLDFVWYGFLRNKKYAKNNNWHWTLGQYVSP